jgi:hypothetical protein
VEELLHEIGNEKKRSKCEKLLHEIGNEKKRSKWKSCYMK